MKCSRISVTSPFLPFMLSNGKIKHLQRFHSLLIWIFMCSFLSLNKFIEIIVCFTDKTIHIDCTADTYITLEREREGERDAV